MTDRAMSVIGPNDWVQIREDVGDSASDSANDGPGVRSSHKISILSGTVYLFGGEKVARVPVDNDMWKLTLGSEALSQSQWERCDVQGATKPPLRIAHSQCVIGSDIYIFGGRQGITMGESPLNDCFAYSTTDSTWKELLPEGDVPSARSFHCMVAVRDRFYVFGGCSADGRLADLYEGVPDVCKGVVKWKLLPTGPPELRGRGGAGFVGLTKSVVTADGSGCLVVLGGFAGEETNDVYVYDIATRKWYTVAITGGSLRPRSVFTCVPWCADSIILIFGGEVSPSDLGHEGAGGFANDLCSLQLTMGSNSTVEGVVAAISTPTAAAAGYPRPRGWGTGDVWDGNLVIHGGLTGDDKDPTRLGCLWKYPAAL
eukprot:m.255604 g.255604  ORF g.255604 m.255604 type:complete len:371 (+) comp19622_c0_seq2:17-1129(+)